MQRLDAAAIKRYGIPRLLLMEHAGLAVAREVERLRPRRGRVAVCCGMGYNGGDGLCAAWHLAARGYTVDVLLCGARARLREEPAVFARILRPMGVRIQDVREGRSLRRAQAALRRAGVLVDAVLGIGARDMVREPAASLIRLMNAARRPIVAADVPSGLDADSGRALGAAVRARVTVTFGLVKIGCMRGDGPRLSGRLIVDPLVFPPQLLKSRR